MRDTAGSAAAPAVRCKNLRRGSGPSRRDHCHLFYSGSMLAHPRTLPSGFIAPCLPTRAETLPSGGAWLHEIKHDGFRIIARKTGAQVRLYLGRVTTSLV